MGIGSLTRLEHQFLHHIRSVVGVMWNFRYKFERRGAMGILQRQQGKLFRLVTFLPFSAFPYCDDDKLLLLLQLRTPFNLMLLNLILSDFLMILCGIPPDFTAAIMRGWKLGYQPCIWVGFVMTLTGMLVQCTYGSLNRAPHPNPHPHP